MGIIEHGDHARHGHTCPTRPTRPTMDLARMAASDLCKAVNAMREPDIPAEIVRCRNIGDLCLVFWEKYDCESTTSVFAFKTSSPGTIFVGRTDDLKASSLAYDVESWKLLKPPNQSRLVHPPCCWPAGP